MLDSAHIFHDFPDVFHIDLPSLPLEQIIEFDIDPNYFYGLLLYGSYQAKKAKYLASESSGKGFHQTKYIIFGYFCFVLEEEGCHDPIC